MKSTFYSKGKLLLTAEYVVLDGAKALALPTKKGQSLVVEKNNSGTLNWTSFDCYNKVWYKTSIETKEFFCKTAPKGNSTFDETLFNILWEAQKMNSNFLNVNNGYTITTHLEFERLWGLGTSSTLINNIAKWANVNAFELLNISFGGSGYDIAAAEAKMPIFYTRNNNRNQPTISKAEIFNPEFKDRLFFIYLEEKKDSKDAIKNYRLQPKESLQKVIASINSITEKISTCNDFSEFENLLSLHEKIIATLLNCSTIKQDRFNDYKGVVKSLGGWGGDFVLATGTKLDMKYFTKKGYHTIIPYKKMIF